MKCSLQVLPVELNPCRPHVQQNALELGTGQRETKTNKPSPASSYPARTTYSPPQPMEITPALGVKPFPRPWSLFPSAGLRPHSEFLTTVPSGFPVKPLPPQDPLLPLPLQSPGCCHLGSFCAPAQWEKARERVLFHVYQLFGLSIDVFGEQCEKLRMSEISQGGCRCEL